MKKYTFLSLLLFCSFLSFGQCPTTDIILTSQEEIDNFSITYPNCTSLTHELRIEEQNGVISNLEGLSGLTSTQFIFILSTHIENFYGLHNVETITQLSSWFNVKIQTLEGLNSVQNMGYLELFLNQNLEDLSGMNNIQSLNNINFFGNNSLEDLDELSFIEIMSSITLGGNNLTSLSGLDNLIKVTGDININHEQIQNLDELANLQIIGGSLHIMFNSELEDITALSNIESLVDLYLLECPNITDLMGLHNLHTVSRKLRVGFNHGLKEMYGLINLKSVHELEIYENDNLISLKGLEYLSKITKRLLINDNPALISIEHLVNVSPSEIDEVIIINNESLSICNYPFICTVVEDVDVYKAIQNNAPGCNTVEEIELSCLAPFQEDELDEDNILSVDQSELFPNPVLDNLTISVPEGITFRSAVVYSLQGMMLMKTSDKNINFSDRKAGIYFVTIETDKGSMTKKIIKNN